MSRQWLKRLAQANSIHIGHSIQLVFSPPPLIIIRAQLSRQWLKRLAQANSIHIGHSIQLVFSPPPLIIIRAQLSRQWLKRLAQANSIHIGHSIQLVFSPPPLISDWIYKKLPPNAGTILNYYSLAPTVGDPLGPERSG